MYKLGEQSLDNLAETHPDMGKIVSLAITISEVDFGINEGKRTGEEQLLMLNTGKSKKLNSKHLKCHCCGRSHAIDVYAWIDGKVNWEFKHYIKIKEAMFKAADKLELKLIWGGDWKSKDGVHFQLA